MSDGKGYKPIHLFNKKKRLKRIKKDHRSNKGEVFYERGKEFHLTNREDLRGKRRYGFKRHTMRQQRRISKSKLEGKRFFNEEGSFFVSYINKSLINAQYNSKDYAGIYEFLYTQFYNFEGKLESFYNGKKDDFFWKICKLCGLDHEEVNKNIFEEHYHDIFMDSLVKFIDSIDNYVYSKSNPFYNYLIYVFPFLFHNYFFSYRNSIDYEDINELEIEDTNYSIDSVNELGVHILARMLN